MDSPLISVAGRPVSAVVAIGFIVQTLGALWATFTLISSVDRIDERMAKSEVLGERSSVQIHAVEASIVQLSGTVVRAADKQLDLQQRLAANLASIAESRRRVESNERRLIRIEAELAAQGRRLPPRPDEVEGHDR